MSDNEESYQGVYSFEPLKAPKLNRGDIDSVRTFFKRYEEYSARWEERQEDGSIEEGKVLYPSGGKGSPNQNQGGGKREQQKGSPGNDKRRGRYNTPNSTPQRSGNNQGGSTPSS